MLSAILALSSLQLCSVSSLISVTLTFSKPKLTRDPQLPLQIPCQLSSSHPHEALPAEPIPHSTLMSKSPWRQKGKARTLIPEVPVEKVHTNNLFVDRRCYYLIECE